VNRLAFIKIVGLTSIGSGMNNLTRLGKFADSSPNSARMPVLFIGHGSPMNALEDNEFVRGFRDIA
jgi:4,5-DOPA dioxygenase extradiol